MSKNNCQPTKYTQQNYLSRMWAKQRPFVQTKLTFILTKGTYTRYI